MWVTGARAGSIQDSGTLATVMGTVGVWQYRERPIINVLSEIIDL